MKSVAILISALAVALLAIPSAVRAQTDTHPPFYFGADLSFANEMDDCGAVYRVHGQPQDVFHIFRDAGHNLVRIRIWNNADWTHYSNLDDVKHSIRRAHEAGMRVLLDFHYSDDWADGDKQIIPAAWANIGSTDALAQALYRYTFDTLTALDHDGLMPDMVQVGNEINREILGRADWRDRPIDWARNAALINAGIRAVRDAGAHSSVHPQVMLHIAQPENVEPWFAAAKAAGVTDFDLIGISYYRKWSTVGLDGLGQVINRLRFRYPGVGVIVVETAYPWTLDYADNLSNVLGEDSLLTGYPATPDGQARYMADITQMVISSGGIGVVTWAPDWVSTHCSTRWGQGSSWENATFFDFHHNDEALPALSYPRHAYQWLVPVTMRFEGAPASTAQLYLWADVFGSRQFVAPVSREADGAFVFHTNLRPGQRIQFQIYDRLPLGPPLLPPTDPTTHAVIASVGETTTTLTYQLR